MKTEKFHLLESRVRTRFFNKPVAEFYLLRPEKGGGATDLFFNELFTPLKVSTLENVCADTTDDRKAEIVTRKADCSFCKYSADPSFYLLLDQSSFPKKARPSENYFLKISPLPKQDFPNAFYSIFRHSAPKGVRRFDNLEEYLRDYEPDLDEGIPKTIEEYHNYIRERKM